MTPREKDFFELNLAYLHAARELARLDPSEAVARLGLSLELIKALDEVGIDELHRKITGRPPRAGQLPEADAIVNTRRALVEGSLLMGLYAEIGGSEVYRQVDLDALSRAYQAYLYPRPILWIR